jgi:hypothetical protein
MLFAPSSQTNSSRQRVTSDDWNRWKGLPGGSKVRWVWSGGENGGHEIRRPKSEGRKMKSDRQPERQLALWQEMREYTRYDRGNR